MELNRESILLDYPNAISFECSKKINEQMEKNICKINIEHNQGTGFLCKIPFPDKDNMLPVFMTNNHLINQDLLCKNNSKIEIEFVEKNDIKKLNLNNRIKYTSKEYDTTIIEIKENDEIKDYLELDDLIMNAILNNNNKINKYKGKTSYIIQYPKSELSVSYGIIDNIYEDKKYNFNHKCCTEGG